MERRTGSDSRKSQPDDSDMAFCFPLLASDIYSPRAIKFFTIEKGGRREATVIESTIYLQSLADFLKAEQPVRDNDDGDEVYGDRQFAVGDTTRREPN